MGVIQAREPMIRKEGVGPTLISREAFSIPPVALQKHASQTTSDHSVVVLEDVPMTMPEVIEPPLRRAIEPLEDDLQRIARLARRQLVDTVDELSMALRSWKPKTVSERIA